MAIKDLVEFRRHIEESPEGDKRWPMRFWSV